MYTKSNHKINSSARVTVQNPCPEIIFPSSVGVRFMHNVKRIIKPAENQSCALTKSYIYKSFIIC